MSTLTAETTIREPNNTRRSMVSFDLSQHTSSSDFLFHPPALSRNSTASPPPSPMLSTPTDSTFMADDFSIKKPRPMSMPPLMMDIDDEPPDYLESVIHLPRWEKCKSLVLPREEEGHEELPPYKCTVFKMGPVRVKPEMDAPGIQTRWRHWRKYYIEVWGTMLRVYNSDPNSRASMLGWWLRGNSSKHQKPQPIMTMSLAGAEAKRALDYAKRPHVLRLTLADGPQWLIRLPSKVEMISWIEHMQAAINISLDLEQRPMPKFITLPHRRLAADTLTPRAVELELARERRRMAQHEILI